MENSNNEEKKKIKEKDLKTVTGGCGTPTYDPHRDERYITELKCDDCKFNKAWLGNYMDGKSYQCPLCDHMTFRGFRFIQEPEK